MNPRNPKGTFLHNPGRIYCFADSAALCRMLLEAGAARWQSASLYFWAVQGRNEVDFVIEAGRACMALEFKSAARWHDRDPAGLKAFLSATPQCKAAILCHNGEAAVKLGEKLWALPVSLVLS